MVDDGGAKSETQDLAGLILEFRERTGESYERIARRGGLLKAHVYKLAKYEIKQLPSEETLQKLAVGLMLPVDVVNRAALASVGIVTNGMAAPRRPVVVETLSALVGGLPEPDQQLLVGIAGLLAARNSSRRG